MFHARIRIPHENNENNENVSIPRKKLENRGILKNQCQNYENHENLSIPCKNNENH